MNTRPIAGFSLTTLDSDGNLINVSEKELLLLSNLTETASIGEREMVMRMGQTLAGLEHISRYHFTCKVKSHLNKIVTGDSSFQKL